MSTCSLYFFRSFCIRLFHSNYSSLACLTCQSSRKCDRRFHRFRQSDWMKCNKSACSNYEQNWTSGVSHNPVIVRTPKRPSLPACAGGNRAGKYVVLRREATVFRYDVDWIVRFNRMRPPRFRSLQNDKMVYGLCFVSGAVDILLAFPLSSDVLICCFSVVYCDYRACISLRRRTSTDNEYTGWRRVEHTRYDQTTGRRNT